MPRGIHLPATSVRLGHPTTTPRQIQSPESAGGEGPGIRSNSDQPGTLTAKQWYARNSTKRVPKGLEDRQRDRVFGSAQRAG